mmetsp:Transcript_1063/g.6783  ORF Transcript_1063/g.6783 Transcript_1063/m.6783 type:complete len:96 (+) Transcript_1063:206-493(+)
MKVTCKRKRGRVRLRTEQRGDNHGAGGCQDSTSPKHDRKSATCVDLERGGKQATSRPTIYKGRESRQAKRSGAVERKQGEESTLFCFGSNEGVGT